VIRMLDYIRYIRESPCVICGGAGEPHHLKRIGMGRNRKNKLREHLSAIPLCHEHHAQLHNTGEMKFTNKYSIDLWRMAHTHVVSYLENLSIID
jgi:hypothetical protein